MMTLDALFNQIKTYGYIKAETVNDSDSGKELKHIEYDRKDGTHVEYDKLCNAEEETTYVDRKSKVVVIVPKTLGARARKFYVSTTKPVKEGNTAKWSLVEGSEIKCVTIISKGNKIRDVDRLRNMYKDKERTTKIEDWEKVAGIGVVTNGEKRRKCELHWYQCKNIGKIEFKVKKWIDEK